jgi:hypothetical protein
MPNEIVPGLWQGSCPPTVASLERMGGSMLVLCAREVQPASEIFPPSITVVRCPLDDDESIRLSDHDVWKIRHAAKAVCSHLRRGGIAAVTCFAGLNRSGVVSALSLHYCYGLDYVDAVYAVRKARGPHAISNRRFQEFLIAEIERNARQGLHVPARRGRIRGSVRERPSSLVR